jgi:hypothetical protein
MRLMSISIHTACHMIASIPEAFSRSTLEAYGLRKPRPNCSRQVYARRFPNDGESLGLVPDYYPPCLLIYIFSSSSSYVCPWTQLMCSNRFQMGTVRGNTSFWSAVLRPSHEHNKFFGSLDSLAFIHCVCFLNPQTSV